MNDKPDKELDPFDALVMEEVHAEADELFPSYQFVRCTFKGKSHVPAMVKFEYFDFVEPSPKPSLLRRFLAWIGGAK